MNSICRLIQKTSKNHNLSPCLQILSITSCFHSSFFYFFRISPHRLEFLSKTIKNLFPFEDPELYYIPSATENGISSKAGGKLYNSYHHYRSVFRKQKQKSEATLLVDREEGNMNKYLDLVNTKNDKQQPRNGCDWWFLMYLKRRLGMKIFIVFCQNFKCKFQGFFYTFLYTGTWKNVPLFFRTWKNFRLFIPSSLGSWRILAGGPPSFFSRGYLD